MKKGLKAWLGDFWGFWWLRSSTMAGQVWWSRQERLGVREEARHWLAAWQLGPPL